ncbi:MAG: prepilin peptidase [Nanoarchaeota archaeon]|nr:prepilin peptidase [Nanoarchaeota archaeon]
MQLEIILISISLIVLLVASIFDLKTREIPDLLSYSFIASVLGIRLIYSLFTNFSFFFYGLLGLIIMFAFGFLLYYLKQWGGGDAKLFMGLGAAFADFYIFDIPFLAILLVLVLFVGAIYAFTWASTLFIKHRKKSFKNFKKLLIKYKYYRFATLSLATIFVIIALISSNLRLFATILALSLLLLFYLFIFIKVVEKQSFKKLLPLSQITEGDWLAKDVIHNNKIICSKKEPCLDNKQIKNLKKHNIRKVWIKIGIPFVPAIFIAFLITIILYLI